MIIRFSEHSDSEINFAHRYEPGEIDLNDEDAHIKSALTMAGVARRSSEIARISGQINVVAEVLCSRCLQPVNVNLNSDFAVEFVTAENYSANNSDEIELSEQDLALAVYDGDQINIDDIVREQVLLDLPVRQLCSDDCQGLCQTCGANKNTDACSCQTETIDPRWSALKELKIKN